MGPFRFKSPYIPRPDGVRPDPTRPLRSEPVRRDEVRIYREVQGDGQPKLWVTMPVGTFRREERGDRYNPHFVGDPALWQPLLDQLATQYEAEYAARLQQYDELVAREPSARMFGSPRRDIVPKPEIHAGRGYEYFCEHCGRQFLSPRLPGNRVRLCSDKCQLDRRDAMQRRWRKANPAHHQAINALRAKRRAEARAGRTCGHCGRPIEAARSTRRFCSDVCRARAHHRRDRRAGTVVE